MSFESYMIIDHQCYFMLHSKLKSDRPTILFIHGLGDSSISYQPYLESDLTHYYNIIVPDLLGNGKSSSADDYSFQKQVDGIEKHLEYLQEKFQIRFSFLILVAHSMGSIHATLLCASKFKFIINGLINVEGSITQYGSFVCENMINAIPQQGFKTWFEDFKQNKIYDHLAYHSIPLRMYYASLIFCHSQTFLENATEMYNLSRALPGKYTHLMGQKYIELSIPKIYCYGDSMCKETLAFLQEHQLESHYFPCKNHFLLTECYNEFIIFIDDYIKQFMVKNT